jgi:hypothetical protein
LAGLFTEADVTRLLKVQTDRWFSFGLGSKKMKAKDIRISTISVDKRSVFIP